MWILIRASCWGQYMVKQVHKTPGTCAFCGKKKSVRKGRKFCSEVCSAKGIRKRTEDSRPFCAFCGVNKVKGKNQKLCSVSCQRKAHRIYMREHAEDYSARMHVRHAQDPTLRSSASERMKDRNPINMSGVKEKALATKKERGFVPLQQRGGNGREMPVPQRILLEALGDGWFPEFVVRTNVQRVNQQRLPSHFKIDIAYPERMLAIEVDGKSHRSLWVRERDAKKERFLAENGWCLLRLWNEEILRDLDTALERIRSKFLI